MALFDLNRAQDVAISTLKVAEVAPKNWHRFPAVGPSPLPVYVPVVSYSWPYNGIAGDDVNVATANATGAYEPKNQGNRANMLGAQNVMAVDITSPRGWIDPNEAYGAPPTPTFASMAPTSRVVAPTTDTVLVLTGTNFMPSSQIEFAGQIERTTYISPTQLSTIIKGDKFTSPDPAVPVRVINGGVATAPRNFAFT